MTNRIRTLKVILNTDYRDEDEGIGVIIQAISMIKGVSTVEKGEVVTQEDIVARNDFKRQESRRGIDPRLENGGLRI